MEQNVLPAVNDALVDWVNPPTLVQLKNDLTEAKPIHDSHMVKIAKWLDNLHVKGDAEVKSSTNGSRVVPKLIRKQAEWRYASLSEPFLSTPDLFNVSPVSWEDKDAAIQNELLLNHQFNVVIDKTKFIDDFVRTAVDEGTAIVRVGWEYADEQVVEQQPVFEFQENLEIVPVLEQIAQLKDGNPTRYEIDVPDEMKQALEQFINTGIPYEPVQVGVQEVEVTKVLYNRPTVEVCNSKNVIIDPTAKGDVSKASFLIYMFESSLSELKKDGRYKNLDKINTTGNSPLSEPDYAATVGSQTFNFADKPRQKFVVYEYWGYWDINKTGIVKPFVASWVGDVLIRMEESPFDGFLPFEVAQYLPVRDSSYGEPDGALLEDNQKIIGAVTRGMIDIMGKSANGQTGVRKDLLDATNRRKFDKGLDYEFNPNVDPRQGVYMHTYPEIPASAQFMLQLQNAEAESLTGVKSFHSGISGQALGNVATAVRGALDAASKRELGILRRLSNCIIRVGRKLISMNSQFLSDNEVIRITNDEFVKIDRNDLAGNFDLRLSISTAEEDHNKAQELAFMLQTVGNTMPPEMTNMILADIAKLRKMPDLANKIENFKPQPSEEQQMMQQLALQKAQFELELLRTEIELNKAKVQSELAAAKKLIAEGDQKSLDFVEQESGTKQERELQLRAEQARSQAELKMLDRQFKQEDAKVDLMKEWIKTRGKQ